MNPEFTTLLFRVVIVGGTIGVTGAIVLVLAFRAFGRPFRASVLIAVLIAFVLLCCLLLLRISFVK
jgi:hypothetical protein